MAKATILPPPRPKILLEMDHDEAEVVLSMLAKSEAPEKVEHATRRMNIVRALDAAGVEEIDVPLVRSKEIGDGREPVGSEREGNDDDE